jgi:hypothetical protein
LEEWLGAMLPLVYVIEAFAFKGRYPTFDSQFHWRHDIMHNDIQHNDTQQKGLICDTQHNALYAIMLSVVIYVLLC